MNRTTKKALSLAVSAVMAFSVGFSAFAEQATPETAQYALSDGIALQAETTDAVAEAGGTTYATLQDAIDANTSGTITLLKDTTESVTFIQEKRLVLDFNGHTLTAAKYNRAILSFSNITLRDDTGKGGTVGTIELQGNLIDNIDATMQIFGGTYRANSGNLFSFGSNGSVFITGGTFYGSDDQPVFLTGGNCAYETVRITGGEFHAGKNQTIFAKGDYATNYLFRVASFSADEKPVFYGDLGLTDPEHVKLSGGSYDRKPAEACLDNSEKPYTVVQNGNMWDIVEDMSSYVATVTIDGTVTGYSSLKEALLFAVGDAISTGSARTGTVTLLKDTQENVIARPGAGSVKNNAITLNLDGHTLTAADPTQPAIWLSGVRLKLMGKDGVSQPAATINGTIETDDYLWLTLTTVNAPEGQPAIIYTGTGENGANVAVKGRSVINGAAGQPAIVADAKVSIGDDSTIRAGANGVLFAKGENAAADAICFNLQMTTLYGDLGDKDTRKSIEFYIASGKSYTKFDRAPADDVIPVGFKAVKSGSLYELKADANAAAAAVGSTQFKTLQAAIDYAAENGGTVTMIKNLSENITIPAGKTITIDLQDRALTGSVTNNGTLYLGMGRVKGSITLGDNAAMYVADYDFLLDATLPTGYSMTTSTQQVGDVNYYQIVKYDTKTHETVKNAVEKVNAYLASINSSYKLETLTEEQINSLAGKAYGDDNNPIVTQHDAVEALGEAALSDYFNTRIGNDYRNAVNKLLNSDLYKVVKMKVETDKQEVKATVDTGKTEAPAVDKKVPEDKQPTKEQAVAKAEEIKNELTTDASTEVSNFKDNNLNNAVKVKDLPNVQQDSEIKLYVAVQLQDVQLGANVETDEKGNVTEVKLVGKTIVFDVTPMAEIDGGQAVKIENAQLNGKVAFRLPIPADVTEKYARVSHSGDPDRYVEIKTDSDGKKYIEINDATRFSPYTVNFTNTLPTVKKDETSAPAATPAPTQAPAQKNDGKDIYYTCTACGYHDWTATDEGYKCNHCGHIESVKQLSGYSNVKGVYEPKTGAAAQKTAVKSAAIPQTSDEMPIAAITLVAVVALLGFGVTAYRKFHN